MSDLPTPNHWGCVHDKKKRLLLGRTTDIMWMVWCEEVGCPEWNRLFMFDEKKVSADQLGSLLRAEAILKEREP